MLEAISRQWSTRMVVSCVHPNTPVRHNRRKAAPTSIVLPEPQFLISSGRRSWTPCLKLCLSLRGSRDSGIGLCDYESHLPLCDSGCHSTPRFSKFTSLTSPAVEGWPFEVKTNIFGSCPKNTKQFPGKQNRRDSAYFGSPPSSPMIKPTAHQVMPKPVYDVREDREYLPNRAVDSLCSQVQTSMHFVEAAGGPSLSRSRASTMQTSLSVNTSAHSSSTSLSSAPKRGRNSFDEEDEMPDDQDRKGKKIRDESPDASSETSKLFACPFSKMDPARYSHQNMNEQDYRNCATGFWKSIPRLKQHLYRCHDRSTLCCERCWQSCMEQKSFQNHVKAQKCEARSMPFEKMDLEKYKLIKGRSHGEPISLWYKIFEILFPDAPRPYSPFAELVIGADMRDLVQCIKEQLPVLLKSSMMDRDPSSTPKEPTSNDVVDFLIKEKLPQVLDVITTRFAESRGLEHVLPVMENTRSLSLPPETTPMVDVEPTTTAVLPRRIRPTDTLHRLLSQQSVLSSDTTATVTGHQHRSNLLLDLTGTSQWSQQAMLNFADEHSQEAFAFDWNTNQQGQPFGEAPMTAVHYQDNAISTVVPDPYKFNEPERPEYPFPRSISPSLASTTQHETNSVALSHDDRNWFMNNDDHSWQNFDPHTMQHDTHLQSYGGEQESTQSSQHPNHLEFSDFNSSSHITGMRTWF